LTDSPDAANEATNRKLFVWQMGLIGLILLLTAIGNAHSTVGNRARAGHPVPFWEALVWEFSSTLMLWLLVPLVYWMLGRFPLTRTSWWRSLPVHVIATVPFSLLHVVGMVLMRIAVYSALDRHYTFTPFWGEWTYEFGNDFLTYAMFAAGLPAFRAYGLWLEAKLDRNVAVIRPATENDTPVDRVVVRKRNREFILPAAEIDRIQY
jgi:hypothetical protein